MDSSSKTRTSALEIREHRVELVRTYGAERVAHPSVLLAMDLEAVRVGCGPDEGRKVGGVLGRRR